MNLRMKALLLALLVSGCGGAETITSKEATALDPNEYYEGVKIGLGTVDGLPGTPTEVSPRGVPLIDGVERPDYLPDGINSWDKRATRVTDDNPTGEMRFNYDDLAEGETIIDAPDFAGFVNGQERYNYCLLHDCPKQGPVLGTHSGAWTSDIYFGLAFSADAFGNINGRGACWTAENDGYDCEFPNTKNWTWGYLEDDGGGNGGPCSVSSNHTQSFPFYNDPIQFAQQAFDMWGSAAKSTPVATVIPSIGVPLSNGREQFTVHCPSILPGSHFGAVMASAGPFGPLTLKTANIKALEHQKYPNCIDPVGGIDATPNPRDFYQYSQGDLQFDAGNMYDRGILCGANQNDQNMLKFIALNVFAHERGHLLGFSHFSTGVMQTGGNCSAGFSAFRGIPAGFTQALNDYVGGGTTFQFPASSDACSPLTPHTHVTPLPTPAPNSSNHVLGRLFE